MKTKKYDEISILHPYSGKITTYDSIESAKADAKTFDYRPVYINLYDEGGIINEIKIEK